MRSVLLVEDNEADEELARLCLGELYDSLDVDVESDGQSALQRLDTTDSLPGLVLLDLNLPLVSGQEVLQTMRAHPRLRTVPVVILSSSGAPHDRREAYEGGANAYIIKPMSFNELRRALRVVTELFLEVAAPPP